MPLPRSLPWDETLRCAALRKMCVSQSVELTRSLASVSQEPSLPGLGHSKCPFAVSYSNARSRSLDAHANNRGLGSAPEPGQYTGELGIAPQLTADGSQASEPLPRNFCTSELTPARAPRERRYKSRCPATSSWPESGSKSGPLLPSSVLGH